MPGGGFWGHGVGGRGVRGATATQVSNDILTAMLTALKGFIRESIQDQNKGELDQMQYGDLKIALEHGRTVYLAAFISGYSPGASAILWPSQAPCQGSGPRFL